MNPSGKAKSVAAKSRSKAKAKKATPKRKATPKPATPKAAGPPVIREAVDVGVPPARLWSAITSPDEINRWLTRRCEFEARPGGRVLYWWSSERPTCPDYVAPSRFGTAAEVRIESWDPPRLLVVRAVNHWPGTVAFRLEPAAGGSRLTVEHEGWPKRDDWFQQHKEGWRFHLDLLRAYLEKPEAEYDAYFAKAVAER